MTTVTYTTDTVRAAAIDDLPQEFDGLFKLVGEGLDIRGFGINVVDLPSSYTTSTHDETDTGQEELYLGLSGNGGVVIDEPEPRTVLLTPGRAVLVPPSVRRTLTSSPDGMRVLVVGGTPGEAYTPPA